MDIVPGYGGGLIPMIIIAVVALLAALVLWVAWQMKGAYDATAGRRTEDDQPGAEDDQRRAGGDHDQ